MHVESNAKRRTSTAPAVLRRSAHGAPSAPQLRAHWARHGDEVRAAQRLRHQIFAGEMGATLRPPAGSPAGHDIDRFDAVCEHLLVHVSGAREAPRLIATCRVLTPEGARRIGGLYTDTEFDLAPLRKLLPRAAELGRSCVHAEWRSGAAILVLWTALGEFVQKNGLDTVIGCASVPMRDGGLAAAALWRQWRTTHLAPAALHVTPRTPLPLANVEDAGEVEVPALIKGYLRCGARMLGAPAWDPEFGTADFPLLLRLADLAPRYRQHFLGTVAA